MAAEEKVDALRAIDEFLRAAIARQAVDRQSAGAVDTILVHAVTACLRLTCGHWCASTYRCSSKKMAGVIRYAGCGGRYEYQRLFADGKPLGVAQEALRQALVSLEAEDAPAGVMPVVLGPGWPGVLLHEAVGHGLEGDFNRKGSSVYAGRIGQRVAAPGVTIVDDGTLEGRRGSLNIDDEGTVTQCTTLIEDGILALPAGHSQRQLMDMAPPEMAAGELRPPADAAHDQYLHARGHSDPAR